MAQGNSCFRYSSDCASFKHLRILIVLISCLWGCAPAIQEGKPHWVKTESGRWTKVSGKTTVISKGTELLSCVTAPRALDILFEYQVEGAKRIDIYFMTKTQAQQAARILTAGKDYLEYIGEGTSEGSWLKRVSPGEYCILMRNIREGSDVRVRYSLEVNPLE